MTRTINKKQVRKVRVRGKTYPVLPDTVKHTDEGVGFTYVTQRGERETFIPVGKISTTLIHW